MNYEFRITEDLGIVGNKKLRLVSWNGNAPKLDLRTWFTDAGGNESAGRGIAISDDEARELLALLTEYLSRQQA